MPVKNGKLNSNKIKFVELGEDVSVVWESKGISSRFTEVLGRKQHVMTVSLSEHPCGR